METVNSMHKWQVIYTKPQKEVLVNRQLEDRGFETYFPFFQVDRGYRRGTRLEAIFPNYLFFRSGPQTVHSNDPLQWLPGARSIVCFGGQPAVVSTFVIDALRLRLESYHDVVLKKQECPFQPGQKVLVTNGPLQGLEAIFQTKMNGNERAQILLQVLGAWRRADIDVSDLASTDSIGTT